MIESGPGRDVIVLVQPDPRARLRMVEGLQIGFEVVPVEPGEDPLRVVRRTRPAAVLLAVRRGRVQHALRACRAIKTDAGSVARVGLLDRWGRIADGSRASSSADGVLIGEADGAMMVDFVRALLAGEAPTWTGTPVRAWWDRLRGR